MRLITTLLLALMTLTAFGQSDTTALSALINANFPDNISGFITPLRLRQVSLALMRSNANLLEENTLAESLLVEDSVKSDIGFYKWNGSFYEEVGLGSGTNWGRSGGFISPLTFTDKLNVDTARFAGNLYPDGSGVNIGRSSARFDTVFANVVDCPTTCLCVRTAKLDIPSAEVLTLNTTPKAFGLTVPAGFYCRILSADAFLDFNSIAYATNLRISISPAGAGVRFFDSVSNFLSSASDSFTQLTAVNGSIPAGYTDYEVFNSVGDPTAGDSDITVYITYVLIPL
jgi:hypothetical protein